MLWIKSLLEFKDQTLQNVQYTNMDALHVNYCGLWHEKVIKLRWKQYPNWHEIMRNAWIYNLLTMQVWIIHQVEVDDQTLSITQCYQILWHVDAIKC
jgi:hypothetical protein